MLIEAPPKNTKSSQLMEDLREAIISGQMVAGSKINLDRTKLAFQVSLSPLREALARLIADGLVVFEDNRGYRVAPVSADNLAEITSLRAEFETFALRDAVASAPADWERSVMQHLHRLNQCTRRRDAPETLEAWEAAHRAFHLALIGGSAKPLLLGFCNALLNLNDRYRRSFLRATTGDVQVDLEHGEIAAAAVARDADVAADRLAAHIRRTGANLLLHFRKFPSA